MCALIVMGALAAGERPATSPGTDAVRYDPAHLDYEVAARPMRPYDLMGLGNAPLGLLDRLPQHEKLTFQAYFRDWPIGNIAFSLTGAKRAASWRGANGKNLTARLYVTPAKGVGLVSKALAALFDASLYLESLIDADNGRSLQFTREETVDDVVVARETLRLDYRERDERGLAAPVARCTEEKLDKKNRARRQERRPYAIPPSVHDPLSVFYHLRALPLDRIGDSARVVLATKKELEVVTLTVVGRETVNLGDHLGRYECLVIEPKCDGDAASIVKARGAGRLWLERHSRVLVQMRADFDAGGVPLSLVARLSDIENNPALRRYRLPAP